MKRVLKTLIPLIILGTILYQFRGPLGAQFLPAWNNLNSIFVKNVPCADPIPYTLGAFDTKFNISESYFLSALTDAEAIWEKPFGKQLFTYAPANSAFDVLKINLIYDYRQQATNKLASLGIVVNDDRATYDALKAKFTLLKTQYDSAKSNYEARVAIFDQKQQTYEADVNSWNKKGGAPQENYNQLQATLLELQTESKDLQVVQTNLNSMVDEINALVVVLNRLVGTLNLSVDKYNTVNTTLGESFEEGVYQSDGVNREINIYEFSDRAKLVRVLAHELGHALGLGHVDDPKAIMYKLNQGDNMVLTSTDLSALKTLCRIK